MDQLSLKQFMNDQDGMEIKAISEACLLKKVRCASDSWQRKFEKVFAKRKPGFRWVYYCSSAEQFRIGMGSEGYLYDDGIESYKLSSYIFKPIGGSQQASFFYTQLCFYKNKIIPSVYIYRGKDKPGISLKLDKPLTIPSSTGSDILTSMTSGSGDSVILTVRYTPETRTLDEPTKIKEVRYKLEVQEVDHHYHLDCVELS